jgi:hypothetical protein
MRFFINWLPGDSSSSTLTIRIKLPTNNNMTQTLRIILFHSQL